MYRLFLKILKIFQWNYIWRTGYLLIFFSCILWITLLLLYVNYARQLADEGLIQIKNIKQERSKVIDSIVVLTGGHGRLAAGINLLEQNIASQMLITGVSKGLKLKQIIPSISDTLIDYISIDYLAVNTLGNATETRAWLVKQNFFYRKDYQSHICIVLVSAHYHLPRALLQFKKLIPEVEWIAYAVEPKNLSLDHWYRYLRGWKIFSFELLKFLWVKFYG